MAGAMGISLQYVTNGRGRLCHQLPDVALQKNFFGRGDSREEFCFQAVTSVSVYASLAVQINWFSI